MGKLEDYDIECYLKDEYTVTIDPLLSNAIGGIKLCVNSEKLEIAQKLVIQFEDERRKNAKCPKCQSNNVEYITVSKPKNWLAAILSFSFANYTLSVDQAYHCFNCGYEFKEIEDIPVDIN
ncbi:MAG: DUF2007 domain-containing protein [Chitinophaga sp.]|jgi:predicted Zn-ribbon and HTH transcriptional regulator|nr:DUF2007 domain-containing protein [Chitinophaga sp.]